MNNSKRVLAAVAIGAVTLLGAATTPASANDGDFHSFQHKFRHSGGLKSQSDSDLGENIEYSKFTSSSSGSSRGGSGFGDPEFGR